MSTVIVKEELLELYGSGKSMMEISVLLNCSVHKVAYWMDKHGIRRRTISDAIYLKLNPAGDPFKLKEILDSESSFLSGLGIGLYWGEGQKTGRTAIRVANGDPGVIRNFRRFLRDICGLEERKLFYSLICFNDSDIDSVRKYWAKELKIPEEKFGKIVQIPKQGKGTYRKKSQFGVCTLVVSNPKLKIWIMDSILELRSLPR